jgi:hypothetical protein
MFNSFPTVTAFYRAAPVPKGSRTKQEQRDFAKLTAVILDSGFAAVLR